MTSHVPGNETAAHHHLARAFLPGHPIDQERALRIFDFDVNHIMKYIAAKAASEVTSCVVALLEATLAL